MVWTDLGRTLYGCRASPHPVQAIGTVRRVRPGLAGWFEVDAGGNATEGVPGDGQAAFGPCRRCGVGFPVAADEAADAMPEDLMEKLRRELDEARETLRAIRSGEADALVIDTGSGEEVAALAGVDQPYRLLVERVAEGAHAYFRAVAIDYDGCLAEGTVAPDTLAALAEARSRGVRAILVTGRIMSELRAVFPEVDEHMDAVVAEDGALLVTHGGVRLLAAPVGRAVSAGLTERGVPHRNGQVIVAGAAADEPAALEVVRELGLDCRLVATGAS